MLYWCYCYKYCYCLTGAYGALLLVGLRHFVQSVLPHASLLLHMASAIFVVSHLPVGLCCAHTLECYSSIYYRFFGIFLAVLNSHAILACSYSEYEVFLVIGHLSSRGVSPFFILSTHFYIILIPLIV